MSLVNQGMADYLVPEPVNPEVVAEFCSGLAGTDFGRCYGWFDPSGVPRGFLAGMILRDPMTGVLSGFEHAWWVNPKYRGAASLALMNAFEDDCRREGCRRLVFGFSQYVKPNLMRRFYRQHGYSEFTTSVSKEL